MDPEERVENEFWHVLKNIKEQSLKTPKKEYVKYWTTNVIIASPGWPTPEDEGNILRKLEEFGVIRLKRRNGLSEYE